MAEASNMMRTSLNLVGDGDEWELIEHLETVFALKFGDDFQNTLTVGDVDEVIWRYFEGVGGDKCMSAMAFYKLRSCLEPRARSRRVSPSDRIADFFPFPRDLASTLKRGTGIRMAYRSGPLGRIGGYLQLSWLAALFSAGIGHGIFALAMLTLAVFGLALLKIDRGRFADEETVGDIARHLAEHNFGILAKNGGRVSRQSVWQATQAAIARFQEFRPEEIGRDTMLISKKYFVFSRG